MHTNEVFVIGMSLLELCLYLNILNVPPYAANNPVGRVYPMRAQEQQTSWPDAASHWVSSAHWVIRRVGRDVSILRELERVIKLDRLFAILSDSSRILFS